MKKTALWTVCLLLMVVFQTQAADYYVDSTAGDDARAGTSPETAWQSLNRVNGTTFKDGDTVHFRCGCLWRGSLKLGTGRTLYTGWGEGEKPRIYGSVALNHEEDWLSDGEGRWVSRADIKFADDIGNIILNGKKAAFKKWTLADLTDEDDFFFDLTGDRRIRYKSLENPARRFQEIEAAQNVHIINHANSDGATVDGLDIRYGAAHGFGGGNVKNLTIRNCDISWIGGGDQMREGGAGRRIRFGNGIEFWDSASNCVVENNRIWEIYDAALTNQGLSKNSQVQLVWRHNEIWNSEYSFEYWNNPEESITADILVEGNTCRDAGYGWGHVQRPDRNGAHLMFYNNRAKTSNFKVVNNTFQNSTEVLLRMDNDWMSGLTFENNQWEQSSDHNWINLYHKRYGEEGLEKLSAPNGKP